MFPWEKMANSACNSNECFSLRLPPCFGVQKCSKCRFLILSHSIFKRHISVLRLNKIRNFYCFFKVILKRGWLPFPLLTACVEVKNTGEKDLWCICTTALICAKVLIVLPTIAFVPLVQMPTK